MNASDLPTVNAILNAIAACFLFAGRQAIKRHPDERIRHRNLMVAALTASAAFLACYLYYHYHVPHTSYEGTGILRGIYFFILITHIPLAALMVPFILAAVWFAIKGRYDRHVRLVRWVWPVWMYVSVTGVLIYLFLYVLPHGAA